jgi:hypothetical protein
MALIALIGSTTFLCLTLEKLVNFSIATSIPSYGIGYLEYTIKDWL